MSALHSLGAHDLLAAYRSRSLSPVEVLGDVLEHIAACEPSLHATYAIDGVTAFTVMPLKIATYMGLLVAFASGVYGGLILIDTLLYGNAVPGYPSLVVIVLFLGGVQLMTLGVIGVTLGVTRVSLGVTFAVRWRVTFGPGSTPP